MKLPKVMRTYCPFCEKHGEHEVRLSRKGKEGTMKRGRRQYERVKAGYGGSPRTPKKHIYKIAKRTVLVLKCNTCNKSHQKSYRARTRKKVEIV